MEKKNKKRDLKKKSFLHVKTLSPLQRQSCSGCFRANIMGYVFSKGAVFQTRWFLSSHRETETTQSQQCSAPRQWHPRFGDRQKDDSWESQYNLGKNCFNPLLSQPAVKLGIIDHHQWSRKPYSGFTNTPIKRTVWQCAQISQIMGSNSPTALNFQELPVFHY